MSRLDNLEERVARLERITESLYAADGYRVHSRHMLSSRPASTPTQAVHLCSGGCGIDILVEHKYCLDCGDDTQMEKL